MPPQRTILQKPTDWGKYLLPVDPEERKDYENAMRLLGWLGVDEGRESDEMRQHIGYAQRMICFNTWMFPKYGVTLGEYETRSGVWARIEVFSVDGHLKPFSCKHIEWGGPYNDDPTRLAVIDTDIWKSDVERLLSGINS